MSASNYLEAAILDHIFDEAAYTAPTWYVALFTADPEETGASGEVSTVGTDYTRIALGATTRTDDSVVNDAAVEFAAAAAAWGTITHFGLFDADTAGNFLAGGALASSKVVGTGDTVKFTAGTLEVTLD